jgi:hypothetical protein
MVLAPRLLHVLRTEAPHVDLAIKPVTRIDLAEQIDLGRIDAAIGTFQAAPSRFKSGLLFEYDDVLNRRSRLRLSARSQPTSQTTCYRHIDHCQR